MSGAVETYADQVLGFWSFGFDEEAKNRLNTVKAALDATITPEERAAVKAQREQFIKQANEERAKEGGDPVVAFEDAEPMITWVIDEAEKRGVCTAEEATYLRGEFVNENNGLPHVINLL